MDPAPPVHVSFIAPQKGSKKQEHAEAEVPFRSSFYDVAPADATCSTINTPEAAWRKVEGAPVSGMARRHGCVRRFRTFARLEDARTASDSHRAESAALDFVTPTLSL